jgi:diguanylate cyclase (GGDEF)-like protein
MGDVNGLKLVNDSFGHTMGDMLLKKVARILKKGCRADDIIARLGGDEFVLLLPKTEAYEAEKIIQRIRNLALKEKAGPMDVSISFGYATKRQEQEDMPTILKTAEDHMYRQKLYESSGMRSKTVDLILHTLYEKSNREMFHSCRVSEICEAIATRMNFNKDDVSQITLAGLMHDIGKIAIEEKILNKPDILDADEWKEMMRHAEIGYRILSSVNNFRNSSYVSGASRTVGRKRGIPKGSQGRQFLCSKNHRPLPTLLTP